MKDFAAIARPLTDLLIGHPTNTKSERKRNNDNRTHFIWGPAQQDSFDAIKRHLISPPVPANADYTKPFSLHTDASYTDLGAVLYKKQDGKSRVIAYVIRSLKPAEKKYPAHKLEFLALKWAVVEKFHDYLYGSKFETYR